jgi:hypothetical protein
VLKDADHDDDDKIDAVDSFSPLTHSQIYAF